MIAASMRLCLALDVVVAISVSLAAAAADAPDVKTIKSFGVVDKSGASPVDIIQGSDGFLYGTTALGGGTGGGTVFRVRPDGSAYSLLFSFPNPTGAGIGPNRLIEATDGMLYGTTVSGGASNAGTIFKLTRDGTDVLVLHSFAATAADGRLPLAGLVEGTNGVLYGTTFQGGTFGSGTVFKVRKDGAGYEVVRSIGPSSVEGRDVRAPLLKGSDGVLYGTAASGGSSVVGTIFKLNVDGNGFTLLHSFSSSGDDGGSPMVGLMEARDGKLYGTTRSGGASGFGTVFRLERDGTGFSTLTSFPPIANGGLNPEAPLFQAADGTLYGTTRGGGEFGLGILFKLNTNGSDFAILRSFGVSAADGRSPRTGLIQRSDGALLGTAPLGGDSNGGTLYEVSTDGTEYTNLWSFSVAGLDAASAYGLTEGRDGFLYGTAERGGNFDLGTLFKIQKNGSNYAIIKHFGGAADAGKNPQASVAEASDGYLYGVSSSGGLYRFGTLFKVSKDGATDTVLRNFGVSAGDGREPRASVIEGSDGNLFGVTASGGSFGFGTLFTLSKDGNGYSVLHSFGSGLDGRLSIAKVIEGKNGSLYGTTSLGGAQGFGTAFKVDKNGSNYLVIKNFGDSVGDGHSPNGELVQTSDGFLYGVCLRGGSFDAGSFFRMDTNGGGYQVRYSFSATGADGRLPGPSLIAGKEDGFYGVTSGGGEFGAGTLFQIGKDGSGYSTLLSLSAPRTSSANPKTVLLGSDGALYGTTSSGGSLGFGDVYRLAFLTEFRLLGKITEAGFELTVVGSNTDTYAVEAALDVSGPWTEIGLTTNQSGESKLLDSGLGDRRFYRARLSSP